MSCPTFFTRLRLPLRQPDGRRHHSATPAIGSSNSFTVLGFRAVPPSTSQYQTLVSGIRNQEQFPFSMAPSFDVQDDAPPPRKKAKTVVHASKLECRICYSLIDDSNYVRGCRTCKKPTCFDCVKGQWLAALSDHERMPVRCCQKVTYHDVAKDILPPAELTIYKLRFDESSTPNPFYCPVPACSTFIPPRLLKPVRGKTTCQVCATTSCVKCRQPASDGHQCPDADEKAAILKSFNYKLCPKCGTGIMRMYGCAHVRCQCGAHWCYDCQRPINACYMKPCSAARDDGQNSEPSDADSDSDGEDATSVVEPTAATSDELGELSATSMTNQEIPHAEASSDDSNSTSLVPTVVVEIVEETTSAARDHATEAIKEEQTAPPQETTTNLDDPDNPDHDWEAEDLDFGDEPSDEYWDVWGCMHRFNDFTAEDIPDQWLANLDPSKTMAIECMGCFKTINIEPMKPLGPMTFLEWMTAKQDNGEDEMEGEIGAEARPVKKEKRRLKKNGAFECRECGIIYCWWCRRTAVRQMSNYRKGTLV